MLRTGTSGFAYREWKGTFYPADLPASRMLAHYASRLPTVEINYTFRRHPSERTLATWRDQVPAGFRFAVKAHRRITHTLRLGDAGEAVRRFLATVAPLGERLGPILFQCPPTLGYDAGLLERFLDGLPASGRYAMEFRHPSWEAAASALRARGVATCVAETDEQAASELSAGPFAYLRLRRSSYTEEELRGWAERLGPLLVRGTEVFCYFKHEDGAAGAGWAERLASMAAAAPA